MQTCAITVWPALRPVRPTKPQQHGVSDQAIKYTDCREYVPFVLLEQTSYLSLLYGMIVP